MPIDIKRALSDKKYLESLTEAERREFLEKTKELTDADLDNVSGGVAASGTCMYCSGEVKRPTNSS